LIDAICQTSPAQAAFCDADRRHRELTWRLFEQGSADDPSISDELIASNERLIELLDLIDRQWGALFDPKMGRCDISRQYKEGSLRAVLRWLADALPGWAVSGAAGRV
jgi:hypothetical protein